MKWLSTLWAGASDTVKVLLIVAVVALIAFLAWAGWGDAVGAWLSAN
jgi:hypothetical protein